MRLLKVVIIGIVAIVSAPAAAGVAEFWQGVALPTREDRRAAAAQFLAELAAVDDALPNLSPTQREWLKREYYDEIARAGGKYTSRSVLARDSIEYHLATVKPRLADARLALTKLAGLQRLHLKAEVELWATTASIYTDMELANSLVALGAKQLLPASAFGPGVSLFPQNQALKANVILIRVVVPYFRGELKS